MADPVTSKVLFRLAALAVDEDGRRNLLILFSVPIALVLLILMIFAYILASPLSFIAGFFTNPNEMAALQAFRAEHGDKVRLQTGGIILNGKYPMPVVGIITSPYGQRVHPVTGKSSFHTGIDIAPEWHSEIKSVADGQVVKVGIDKNYGNYILIKHDDPDETFYSFYAHLSKIFALPDQEIFTGDIIGLEGGDPELDPNPGTSTGHHLHFEIRTSRLSWSHTDPVPYLYTPKGSKEEENSSEGT
ncbi:M23 family metallopeptidase [Desulfosporosinus lacus]|uniref:Murein DD-endopeptidase MepM and murein hydrolase activator NlpD, contain LysM domain n=1 Tax=Desulfosporosinus lacus DSM 15449 TaxID=1121420 RepID=A0A1M5Q927_9FIRM|nr:M23 family metallopeptidase [Desulfosporosinus lacus]SHH10687.1 Murein DD-endopeptidase MepM and murein hydrolase activator NlpD, contain LysM domain [Desulfosporosinus lacus DSM 15449]